MREFSLTHQKLILFSLAILFGSILVVPTSATSSIGISTRCDAPAVEVGSNVSCDIILIDLNNPPIAPTGTVTFSLNPPAVGTLNPLICPLSPTPLPGASTCSFTLNTGSAGNVVVTASYSGDATHSPVQIPISLTVTTIHTVVSCSPTSVDVNQNTNCTASITDTAAPGSASAPTGTVNFSSIGIGTAGTFDSTSCTLTGTGSAATCSLSVSYMPSNVGTHKISAYYPGDALHGPGYGTFDLAVTSHPTVTNVICSPTILPLNELTTCTAVVIDISSAPSITPSGIVRFTLTGSSTTFFASGPLFPGQGPSATTIVSLIPGSLGTNTVVANYEGDNTHASSSGSTSVTVVTRSTTTLVECLPNVVIVINQPVTCTAFVQDTASPEFTTPSGTVSFTFTASGSPGNFGTPNCNLSGTGDRLSCFVNFIPSQSGSFTATADYTGDPSHSPSSGVAYFSVTQRTIRLDVTCSPSTVLITDSATCTGQLTDTSQGVAITPSGTIRFSSFPLGARGSFNPQDCPPSGSNGLADCSVTFTTIDGFGQILISAAVDGTLTHSPASSSPFTLTVNPRATSVSVTPRSFVVTVGSVVSYTATVTDTSPGTVSFPDGWIYWSDAGASGSFATIGEATGACMLSQTGPATSSCTIDYTAPSTANSTIAIIASYVPTDRIHSNTYGFVILSAIPPITLSGISSTTLSSDSSRNTVIGLLDPSGTLLAQVILPSNTSFDNTVTISYSTTAGNSMLEVSGAHPIYPATKSVVLSSTATSVCIVDRVTSVSLGDVPNCNSTDIRQSQVLIPCNGVPQSFTFDEAPTSRSYICSPNYMVGFLKIDGLANSFVETLELPAVMKISSSTTLAGDILARVVVAADKITLNCNGHTISGTTTKPLGSTNVGVLLSGRSGVTLKNCRISNFAIGAELVSSNLNLITGTTASNNGYGFLLSHSSFNLLSGNTAFGNFLDGIRLEYSSNNAIGLDTSNRNNGSGFYLLYSSNNALVSNVANNNLAYGFAFVSSNNNIVQSNNACGSGLYDAYQTASTGNRFIRNIFCTRKGL